MRDQKPEPSSNDAPDESKPLFPTWFYIQRGDTYGPISSTDLRAAAHLGFLGPEDMVRRADQKAWVPARRVKGLFAKRD